LAIWQELKGEQMAGIFIARIGYCDVSQPMEIAPAAQCLSTWRTGEKFCYSKRLTNFSQEKA
jgi:hypothetical protein